VVTNVANSLKSRALEVRDNARKALVEIIKILGPNFMYNIIKEMTNVLLLGNFAKEFIKKLENRLSETCVELLNLCAFIHGDYKGKERI